MGIIPDYIKNNHYLQTIRKAFRSFLDYGLAFTIKKIQWRNLSQHTDDQKRILFEKDLYHWWIIKNEKEINQTEKLKVSPLISLLMQVDGIQDNILEEGIKSVLAQTYKNWELFLIHNGNLSDNFLKILSKYENKEKIFVTGANNISSRKTIDRDNHNDINYKGEYISFINGKDLISPNALFETVKLLNKHPEYDFIYSDEDKITQDGKHRYDPFFKPDWSPETFWNFMYTNQFSLYRTELAVKTGIMTYTPDSLELYDFSLRFLKYMKNDRIGHISKVLYHCREISTSYNSQPNEMERLIKEKALLYRELPGKTEKVSSTDHYRIIFNFPVSTKVSIIIPSKDNPDLLKQCINSIVSQSSYPLYEIIVIDNGSTEQNRSEISEFTRRLSVKYIYRPMEFNFSKMCNIGAETASGTVLLFLNDDTKITQNNWLERMTGIALQDHAGAIGAKLLYPDSDLIQHIGVINPQGGPGHYYIGYTDNNIYYYGRNRFDYNLLCVTGACLMVTKEKFLKVGKFDESFPVAYNDVDLCFRLHKAGYYNSIRNDVTVIHFESASRGLDKLDENKMNRLVTELEYLFRKHPDMKGYDPFFNQNLDQFNSECKIQNPFI